MNSPNQHSESANAVSDGQPIELSGQPATRPLHLSRHDADMANGRSSQRSMGGLLLAVGVISAALGAGIMWFVHDGPPNRVPLGSLDAKSSPADEGGNESHGIVLEEAKWAVAGIRIETVERQSVTTSEWVTGKIALNTDRVAQIDPLVDGIVHEVKVRYGDHVTTGQVLAIIDSREVGQAKLEYFQNRLATRLATTDAEWQRQIDDNVQALIVSLRKGIPIAKVTEQFADKAMGSYREQLVSAYARLHKSRTDNDRLKGLAATQAVAGKEYIASKATFEADQAMLQALLEQIRFESHQSRLAADQSLEKAKNAEVISATNLRILGVTDAAGPDFDPTMEGQTVSHYSVKAPFDGVIIEKDVVVNERVGPMSQLFVIADLKTVWIAADIYERHMAMLPRLKDHTIRFRTAAIPDQTFEANVFSTGSIVNEASRTLPLTAVAENSELALKPGMFVDVELPGDDIGETLSIPSSAVQEHEGQTFVFVHRGDDRFERRDVKVGRKLNETMEIIAGVREGDHIVNEGGFFLKSQMLSEQFADDD